MTKEKDDGEERGKVMELLIKALGELMAGQDVTKCVKNLCSDLK